MTTDVLTVHEAASLLRVSEDGLRREAVKGEIPCRRICNQYRFSRTALLQWLAEGRGKEEE